MKHQRITEMQAHIVPPGNCVNSEKYAILDCRRSFPVNMESIPSILGTASTFHDAVILAANYARRNGYNGIKLTF